MSRKVRLRNRSEEATDEKTAITVRLGDDLYQIVKLIAVERNESLNQTAQLIIAEWWKAKPERERVRYEEFLGRKLPRP